MHARRSGPGVWGVPRGRTGRTEPARPGSAVARSVQATAPAGTLNVPAGRIVRALFNTAASDLMADPSLLSAFKGAGFTHVHQGFFVNPVDNLVTTFAPWQATFDPWFAARANDTAAAGVRWVATGDDLCRPSFKGDLRRLVASTTGDGPQMVRYAAAKLAATGLCDLIEMVDETNIFWTAPLDGPYTIVRDLRSAPGCPAIGWPCDVGQNSQNPGGVNFKPQLAAFGTPDLSNFGSVYSPPQVWFVSDLPNSRYSVAKGYAAMNAGFGLLPDDGRARSTLIPFSGDFGTWGAGGTQTVQQGAWSAGIVQIYMWVALAKGARYLRFYAWDTAAWAATRVSGAPGSAYTTGTTPTVGPDRWQAASVSNNLIAQLEARLTAPALTAPAWGAGWVTAARAAPAGDGLGCVWGVNVTNGSIAAPSPLDPFPTATVLDPSTGRTDSTPAAVAGTLIPSGGVLVIW